jgi:hypothetical protein
MQHILMLSTRKHLNMKKYLQQLRDQLKKHSNIHTMIYTINLIIHQYWLYNLLLSLWVLNKSHLILKIWEEPEEILSFFGQPFSSLKLYQLFLIFTSMLKLLLQLGSLCISTCIIILKVNITCLYQSSLSSTEGLSTYK